MLDSERGNERYAEYDPAGFSFTERMLTELVGTRLDGLSNGIVITDDPVERVTLPPLAVDAEKVRLRLVAAAWSAVPLLLAAAIFRLSRHRAPRARGGRARAVTAPAGAVEAARPTLAAPTPRPTAPSFARSLAAEVTMTWRTAPFVRWALLGLAVAAGIAWGTAGRVALAGFLLLLAPVIAEVAAREHLAGTAAMVFAQPGTPRSVVVWKTAATLGLVLALAAPALLRALAGSPARALALLLGLVFVATAAAGLGWLTRGGKLFLGGFILLWYLAIQGGSPVDFTGSLGPTPDVPLAACFAAAGVAFALAAWAAERRAARGA
jgi:hypothetical protein